MSELLDDRGVAWAALIIVVLPLVIIGAGELEERLRQRDSRFGVVVSIVRVWIVPLFALWTLASGLFAVEADNVLLRMLGTALLLSLAFAALSALGVVVADLMERPRRSGQRPIPRLVLAMPRLLVILATGWLLVAGVWGVDLSAALTALGVTSLVISFALQDTLGGIASGFALLADSPFGPDDWIEADGVEGRVVDVNWRSTRVQDRNGDLVVVPNGQLANVTITNYDRPSRLHRVKVPVQIDRSAPPTAAIGMLVDAARSTPGVLADPPPFAVVRQIADPVVDYETMMWIDDFSRAPQIKADFGALVWYLSYRHDVPLPNPAQDLYLFDGAKAAVESKVTAADLRLRLVDSPLLADLDADLLDLLAASARLAHFRQGETIMSGTSHRELALLHAGRAGVVLQDAAGPVATALPALEVEAGEIVAASDEPLGPALTVSVVALTDCEVITLTQAAAEIAIARAPELAGALEQIAQTRRRRLERALRRAVQATSVATPTTTDGGNP